jgi:hypothetical protein
MRIRMLQTRLRSPKNECSRPMTPALFFRQWPSRWQQKIFLSFFLLTVLLFWRYIYDKKARNCRNQRFLTTFAWWWKDPDPYLWLTDPEGPKTYGSGTLLKTIFSVGGEVVGLSRCDNCCCIIFLAVAGSYSPSQPCPPLPCYFSILAPLLYSSLLTFSLLLLPATAVSSSYCARSYRPSFRENMPKRSFSVIENESVFHENWVFKFGHCMVCLLITYLSFWSFCCSFVPPPSLFFLVAPICPTLRHSFCAPFLLQCPKPLLGAACPRPSLHFHYPYRVQTVKNMKITLRCKEPIPKIWNKSSQKRNCAATVPISTCMCLWAIYIYSHDRSAFSALQEICGPFLGIYKSLTDAWIWKLGLRPRNSQKRNT